MGLLRPEEMRRGTLVVQADRARDVIEAVGSLSCMQFEDMNSLDLQRPYRKHIQRIDDVERTIRSLHEDIMRLPGIAAEDVVTGNVDAFLARVESYTLNEVEAELARLRADFIRLHESTSALLKSRAAAVEAQCIAQVAATFARAGKRRSLQDGRPSLAEDAGQTEGLSPMLSTVAGLLEQQDQVRFSRAVFRATYGNVFAHLEPMGNIFSDMDPERRSFKSAFVLVFHDGRHGAQESAMAERVRRLCSAFGARVYPWYTSSEEASAAHADLGKQIVEQSRLLDNLRRFMQQEAGRLCSVPYTGGNSLIEEWRLFCMKEKAIYGALNGFETGGVNLRADCWYPAREEESFKALLSEFSVSRTGSFQGVILLPHKKQVLSGAPTYVRTNALTEVVQLMVDTYGVPRYREANPALFTLVTFPFLFGVMYGDVGHGFLLFLAGLVLIRQGDSLQNTSPALYSCRYLVTLMGFFATYCGFLYDDFFSVGIPLFASRWLCDASSHPNATFVLCEAQYDTRNEGGLGPYPFGVDHAWHGAQNELIFMNSLKMKLSVVLGVVHMLSGLALRCFNALCDCNMLDLVCECAPMALFMVSFFGFMDIMILHKWVTPMETAPSIINSMICMAMPGTVDPAPMFGPEMPRRLMICSLLAVPWLLVPKPLLLWYRVRLGQSQTARRPTKVVVDSPLLGSSGNVELTGLVGPASCSESVSADVEVARITQHMHEEKDEEEPFDLAEVLIHQTIETIEYVLGTVSHVASYLRLWALSLAHQQLSEVFFRYTLGGALGVVFPLNVIALYVMFAVWAGITTAVLLGMDVMECFLHTLRLHWVEFQSKFYKADGLPFQPLCFRVCLRPA